MSKPLNVDDWASITAVLTTQPDSSLRILCGKGDSAPQADQRTYLALVASLTGPYPSLIKKLTQTSTKRLIDSTLNPLVQEITKDPNFSLAAAIKAIDPTYSERDLEMDEQVMKELLENNKPNMPPEKDWPFPHLFFKNVKALARRLKAKDATVAPASVAVPPARKKVKKSKKAAEEADALER
jgi:hypothetical protein